MKTLGTVILFWAAQCLASFQHSGAPFKAPVNISHGFTAHVIFSNLTTPRGITIDSSQNILVVERGLGVTAFSPSLTLAGWDRTVVIQNTLLTQGIQVDGEKLYVSTAGDVLLYNYNSDTKSVSSSTPVTLITGVPPDGGGVKLLNHICLLIINIIDLTTHTLQLEKDALDRTIAILVASGPLTNIDITARDPASGRSQVRRFVLLNATPQEWSSGQIIAFGIRNPAGIAFPQSAAPGTSSREVYVVENGASIDNVTGLTAAFVNDNPADELELVSFDTAVSTAFPESFGFPDCTTLWNPQADPIGDPQFLDKKRGDQFSLNLDPLHNDSFCQILENNHPPLLSFQVRRTIITSSMWLILSIELKGTFGPSGHQIFPSNTQR